jgi:hypothetical protein
MSYSKAGIFNLALGALLLERQVIDTATDRTKECRVLNTHWETALKTALAEMDLDSCSTTETLELITADPNDLWSYAYKYPSNCAFFRRIANSSKTDNRSTHIEKRLGSYSGQKVIFTNEYDASGEYIAADVDLATISGSAAMAIALKLAYLSAPLIVGKGANSLRTSLRDQYNLAKADAQALEGQESFSYDDDEVTSEFVAERMS